jgi:hypothetical protein
MKNNLAAGSVKSERNVQESIQCLFDLMLSVGLHKEYHEAAPARA